MEGRKILSLYFSRSSYITVKQSPSLLQLSNLQQVPLTQNILRIARIILEHLFHLVIPLHIQRQLFSTQIPRHAFRAGRGSQGACIPVYPMGMEMRRKSREIQLVGISIRPRLGNAVNTVED